MKKVEISVLRLQIQAAASNMVVGAMAVNEGSNLHNCYVLFCFCTTVEQQGVDVEKSNIFMCDLWLQLDLI